MGQFSWLDCITEEQIIDDKVRDVYVLVPKEFRDKYGERIKETCYDGYGHFGLYDIYDLVAEWNREKLTHRMLTECMTTSWTPEDIKYYISGLKRQMREAQKLLDYKEGVLTEDEMTEKYGEDWKRILGIDIACYDKQNKSLPYPIKITHDGSAIYENCQPSLSDPHQGWEMEDYESEDDEW